MNDPLGFNRLAVSAWPNFFTHSSSSCPGLLRGDIVSRWDGRPGAESSSYPAVGSESHLPAGICSQRSRPDEGQVRPSEKINNISSYDCNCCVIDWFVLSLWFSLSGFAAGWMMPRPVLSWATGLKWTASPLCVALQFNSHQFCLFLFCPVLYVCKIESSNFKPLLVFLMVFSDSLYWSYTWKQNEVIYEGDLWVMLVMVVEWMSWKPKEMSKSYFTPKLKEMTFSTKKSIDWMNALCIMTSKKLKSKHTFLLHY